MWVYLPWALRFKHQCYERRIASFPFNVVAFLLMRPDGTASNDCSMASKTTWINCNKLPAIPKSILTIGYHPSMPPPILTGSNPIMRAQQLVSSSLSASAAGLQHCQTAIDSGWWPICQPALRGSVFLSNCLKLHRRIEPIWTEVNYLLWNYSTVCFINNLFVSLRFCLPSPMRLDQLGSQYCL